MAVSLVKEDGSVVEGANSYADAADATTYYTNQGYSDTADEASLIRGSRALDERYRHRLQGVKTTSGQSMVWPRYDVFDEDGNLLASNAIPDNVQRAAMEMARTVATDHSADGPSSVKSVKAGSVAVEFQRPQSQTTILSYVDELMRTYLAAGGNRVVRA